VAVVEEQHGQAERRMDNLNRKAKASELRMFERRWREIIYSAAWVRRRK
jgi:hypothetical protein